MKNVTQIVDLFASKSPDKIIEGIKELCKQQVHFVTQRISHSPDFQQFIELLPAFDGKPIDGFTQVEWDKIRFYVYLACAPILNQDFPITTSTFLTEFGPLCSLLSFYGKGFKNKEQNVSIARSILIDYFQKLLTTSEKAPFYSRSDSANIKYIRNILDSAFPFIEFFETLAKIDVNKLTENDYSFFFDTLVITINNIRSMPKEILSKIQVITNFFTATDVSPSFIIDLFFKLWIKFCGGRILSDKDNQAHPDPENMKRIEVVSCVFDKATKEKYTQIIPRPKKFITMFNFEHCLPETTQQGRVMNFISYIIKKIPKIGNFFDADKCSEIMCMYFKKKCENSFYYYYMHSLASIISMMNIKIDNIQIPALSTKFAISERKKLCFSAQTTYSPGACLAADKILYTELNTVEVATPEQAVKMFDEATKAIKKYDQSSYSPILITIENIKTVIKKLGGFTGDIENPGNAIIFYEVRNTISELMKFLVTISYKATHYKYVLEKLLKKPNDAVNDAFRENVTKISEFFKSLPQSYEKVTAEIVAESLFNAVKEGRATAALTSNLTECLASNRNLTKLIFESMMNIAVSNSSLFISPILSETVLICSWILFTIRFGFRSKTQNLMRVLNYNKKIIVDTTFKNMKFISNQYIVMKTIALYMQIIRTQQDSKIAIQQANARARYQGADDFQACYPYTQSEAIMVYLDLDTQMTNTKVIELALKSDNPHIISRGSEAIIKLIRDSAGKTDFSSDSMKSLLNRWYSTMRYAKPDELYLMMSTIIENPNTFMFPPEKNMFEEMGIEYEPTGCDIAKFLSSVYSSVKEDEQEGRHIIGLLNICFTTIVNKFLSNPKRSFDSIKQIIQIALYLSKFENLRGQIVTLMDKMNDFLLEPFCTGLSTNYLICLFTVCGSSRSVSTKFLELSIDRFLAKVVAHGCSIDIIKETIDSLLETPYNQFWLQTILVAFDFVLKYFPTAITPEHIANAVVLDSFKIMISLKIDDGIIQDLSDILDRYENTLTFEQKQQYMLTIYKLNRRQNILSFIIFFERFKKLGIPLKITDFSDVQNAQVPEIYIFKITLLLTAGAEIGQPPMEDMRKLTKYVITSLDQRNAPDKQLQCLVIINAILLHQESTDIFFSDSNIRKNIPSSILSMCIKKLPFKALTKIATNSISLMAERFALDEQVIGKIREKATSEQTFPTFAHITPRFCNAESIKIVIARIQEFSDLPDEDRILKWKEIVICFNTLAKREILDIPKSRDTILPLIVKYAQSIIKLIPSRSIPFWSVFAKSIFKFAILFSKTFMECLFMPEIITNQNVPKLVEYLIVNDKTDSFLNDFLSVFCKASELSIFPFPFLEIFTHLAKMPRYRNNSALQTRISTIFRKLLDSFDTTRISSELPFIQLSLFAKAQIELINPTDPIAIIEFAHLFVFSEFYPSDVYQIFKTKFFKRDESMQDLYNKLIINSIQQLQFIPTRIFNIIVSNSLKVSKIPATIIDMLWNITSKNLKSGKKELKFSGVYIMRVMLEQELPILQKCSVFLPQAQSILESSDADTIIEFIRSLIAISKIKKLPYNFFFDVLKHLLTNGRLLDDPFKKYAFELMHIYLDSLTELPLPVVESLLYYIVDRWLIQAYYSRISNILGEFPIFKRHLPVSFVAVMAHSYIKHNMLGNFMVVGINFCEHLELTDEERRCFYPIALEYLTTSFKDRDKIQITITVDQLSALLVPLLKFMIIKPAGIEFNYKLVKDAYSNLLQLEKDSPLWHHMIVASIMFKYASSKEIQGSYDFVERIVKWQVLLRDDFHEQFFRTLINSYTRAEIADTKFYKLLCDTICELYRVPCRFNFLKAKIMIEEVCSSKYPHVQFLTEAWKSLNTMYKNNNNRKEYFDHMCVLVENISCLTPSEQPEYLSFILGETDNKNYFTAPILTVAHRIIVNSSVDPLVRKKLIYALPKLLEKGSSDNHERILEALEMFHNETSINVFDVQVTIMVLQAARFHSTLTKTADAIIKLIGSDAVQRLKVLSTVLPLSAWCDANLPFIVLLLDDQTPEWNVLISISYTLKDIGAQLATRVITKLIENAEAAFLFKKLLCGVMQLNLKEMKHFHLVEAMVTAFNNKGIDLGLEIIRRAAKIVPLDSILSKYCDENTVTVPLLLQGSQNNKIFSKMLPNLSSEEAAAAATFFLGSYDLALECFNICSPSSIPCFEKMREITMHINAETSDITHQLRTLDLRNDIILDKIVSVASRIKTTPGESLAQDIASIEKMNIRYAKSKFVAATWQKTRIVSIQMFVNLAKEIANNGKLIERHKQLSFNEQEFLVNNLFLESIGLQSSMPTLRIIPQDGQCIVLPRRLQPIFPEGVGYTKFGDIVVPVSSLEQRVVSHLQSLQENMMHHNSSLIWNHALGEIFISTQMPYVFKALIQSEAQTIKESTSQMTSAQATGRIIFYFKVALRSTNEMLLNEARMSATELSRIETKKKEGFLFWIQQVNELSPNRNFFESIKDITKSIDYNIAMFTHNHEQYMKQVGEPRSSDPRFAHIQVESFFDTLFSIDWNSYNKQQRTSNFINETASLPAELIGQIDIKSIRERIPETAFDISVCRAPEEAINEALDFAAFSQRCKEAVKSGETNKLVNEIIPCDAKFEETTEQIQAELTKVNSVIQFFIPTRHGSTKITFTRISREIEKLGDNMFLLSGSLSLGGKQFIVVERRELSNQPATLVNIIQYIRQIMLMEGLAPIASPITAEVGPRYLVSFMYNRPHFLSNMFSDAVGCNPYDWEQTDENIKALPTDRVKKFFVNSLSTAQFTSMRNMMLKSTASVSVVRQLFGAVYPSLYEVAYSFATGEQICFVSSLITKPDEETQSSIRLSPNMISFLGDDSRGKIALSISTIAKALNPYIFIITPFIRLLAMDKNPELPVEKIKEKGEEAIDRFRQFVPPYPAASTAHDAVEWMETTLSIIDNAISPEGKPSEAIPWF